MRLSAEIYAPACFSSFRSVWSGRSQSGRIATGKFSKWILLIMVYTVEIYVWYRTKMITEYSHPSADAIHRLNVYKNIKNT